jgi:AMP phosphorylase
MEEKFTVKILDIMEGRPEAVMNDNDLTALGIYPTDRIRISIDGANVIAIAKSSKEFIRPGFIGLSPEVIKILPLKDGAIVSVTLSEKPHSVAIIKKKMDKQQLAEQDFMSIIEDIKSHNLSSVELCAFVSALYINDMNMEEIKFLTVQLAKSGEILNLKNKPVFDKHSLGGVPGNKISLLIVPIVAAAGLTIPKTSSRAITSACGTADIMEVLAPVTFNTKQIEDIVNEVGGIIAWGGGANLAPVDDYLIQIEHNLLLNPRSLAIASIMAKKLAVGANFVVIDLPMGHGTKIPDVEEAKKFARDFIEIGEKLEIDVECVITYGDKAIGRAVGPALEAKEALKALETGEGPSSLIEKVTEIAGVILESGGVAIRGKGKDIAYEYLKSGKAHKKMLEIIKAQGGDPNVKSDSITVGKYSKIITSTSEGYSTQIDNDSITQIVRAAGSPKDKGAGLYLFVSKGMKIIKDQPLYEIYSNSEDKLEHAVKLANRLRPVKLEGMILQRIPDYKVM